MDDSDNELTKDKVAAETADTPSEPTVASARRRLLKRGLAVAPVVLTLASRPALAWHCKSPSAWGSEVINPNTSLKNNAGHASYIDETWKITNWRDNTPRTAVTLENGGVAGKPWSELISAFPTLYNNQTKSSNKGKSYFDYQKVTVRHLVDYVKVTNPGFSLDDKVKGLLYSSPESPMTYALIAQLNYQILKLVRFNNGIDDCLKKDQLADMASGRYMENGKAWDLIKVKDYVFNNYIVRP